MRRTSEQFGPSDFLRRLPADGSRAKRRDIGLADRASDLARQFCRRAGWAVYRRGDDGKDGWHITDLGRSLLKDFSR